MILIRHGESEFNVVFNKTRVDPGIPDPALTDEEPTSTERIFACRGAPLFKPPPFGRRAFPVV